jgi:hypothetical protein
MQAGDIQVSEEEGDVYKDAAEAALYTSDEHTENGALMDVTFHLHGFSKQVAQ